MPKTRSPKPARERKHTVVFGAVDEPKIGGKPKYLALILTTVLLLFLIGVAAWAAFFLDDGLARFLGDPEDTLIAGLPEDTNASPNLGNTGQATNDLTVASLPQSYEDTTLQGTLAPAEPAELSDDAARARYAATGIWQMAPVNPRAPSQSGLEDFYQTSIDRKVNWQDAIALPDQAALAMDTRPPTPGSPPLAGTVFELDERGLVIATLDGALTPDGIRIYAGQPPVVPTNIPKRAAQAASSRTCRRKSSAGRSTTTDTPR